MINARAVSWWGTRNTSSRYIRSIPEHEPDSSGDALTAVEKLILEKKPHAIAVGVA
jgi:hypothetical protein